MLGFPYDVRSIPFVRYSSNSFPKSNISKKHIIPGPNTEYSTVDKNEEEIHEFHEIVTSRNDSDLLAVKSHKKDFKKKNASVRMIGFQNATYADTFITGDNKFVLFFKYIIAVEQMHYNIYDIENDKWVFDFARQVSIVDEVMNFGTANYVPRWILINDEIMIVSQSNEIYFFNLKDIKNPLFIAHYTIKSETSENSAKNTNRFGRKRKNYDFTNHAICCIDCKIRRKSIGIDLPVTNINNSNNNSNNDNNNNKPRKRKRRSSVDISSLDYYSKDFHITLLIFGGGYHDTLRFRDTFIQLNVILSITRKRKSNNDDNVSNNNDDKGEYEYEYKLKVSERQINGDEMKCFDFDIDDDEAGKIDYNYSAECIKHEKLCDSSPIIAVIGGNATGSINNTESIIFYHYKTNMLTQKKDVK